MSILFQNQIIRGITPLPKLFLYMKKEELNRRSFHSIEEVRLLVSLTL
ncbi:hypothetical protein EFD32_1918 [Enterococcus faecalis D32]|nr:hypothetical protein EFD32_1918 [Enterococcus faecalis D32]